MTVGDWCEYLAVEIRIWSYTFTLAKYKGTNQLYLSFELLQH